jgi:hypothetical protein
MLGSSIVRERFHLAFVVASASLKIHENEQCSIQCIMCIQWFQDGMANTFGTIYRAELDSGATIFTFVF